MSPMPSHRFSDYHATPLHVEADSSSVAFSQIPLDVIRNIADADFALSGEVIENRKIINIAGISASALSIFLSFVVLIVYITLRKRHPALANRVSLRMAVAIQIADLFYNTGTLFGLLPEYIFSSYSSYVCIGSAFVEILFGLFSMALICCLALNLIIVFVFNKTNTRKFEKWYYIMSVILSAGIAVVPLLFDRLGRGRYDCWFKSKPNENLIIPFLWEWLSFYLWVGFSVGFCFISTFLFWWSLSSQAKQIEEQAAAAEYQNQARGASYSSTRSEASNLSKMVKKAVSRISYYCLVPFLAQICKIVVTSLEYVSGKPTYWQLALAAIVAVSSQGTLNALIFFFDPAISRAREENRVIMVKKHVLRYEGAIVGQDILESDNGSDVTPNYPQGYAWHYKQRPITLWEKYMHVYTKTFLLRKRDNSRFRLVHEPDSDQTFLNFAATAAAAVSSAPGAIIAVQPNATAIANSIRYVPESPSSVGATIGSSTSPSTLGRLSLWSNSIATWTTSSGAPWKSNSSGGSSGKTGSVATTLSTVSTPKPLNKDKDPATIVSSPVDEVPSTKPTRTFSWGNLANSVLADGRKKVGSTDSNYKKQFTDNHAEENILLNSKYPPKKTTLSRPVTPVTDVDEERFKMLRTTTSHLSEPSDSRKGSLDLTESRHSDVETIQPALGRPSTSSLRSDKRYRRLGIRNDVANDSLDDLHTTSSTIVPANQGASSVYSGGRRSPALTISTSREHMNSRFQVDSPLPRANSATSSLRTDLPQWDSKRSRTANGFVRMILDKRYSESIAGSSVRASSPLSRSNTPSSMLSRSDYFRDDISVFVDTGEDEDVEYGRLTPTRARLISMM